MMWSRTQLSVQRDIQGFATDREVGSSRRRRKRPPRVSDAAASWRSATEDPGRQHRSAEQCGDHRCRSLRRYLRTDGDVGQLEIVDGGDRDAVNVDAPAGPAGGVVRPATGRSGRARRALIGLLR